MDSITDAWEFFVYVPLPYIAVAVFVVGMAYRIRRWWKLPRAKAVIFPAASSSRATATKVGGDILLFLKTFKGSKALWAMAYFFHLGLALALVGHVRTITEVRWFWNLFGIDKDSTIDDVTFVLGAIAGVLLLAGALFLLVRRLTPTWRVLSLFEDYFALTLLLAIIVSGSYMRFLTSPELEEIRDYTTSVLTFRPEATVSNPLFLTHFLLALILIMYFPFSKLVHLISKPVTDSWTVR